MSRASMAFVRRVGGLSLPDPTMAARAMSPPRRPIVGFRRRPRPAQSLEPWSQLTPERGRCVAPPSRACYQDMEMLTDLSTRPFAGVLRTLSAEQRSGDLQVRSGRIVK